MTDYLYTKEKMELFLYNSLTSHQLNDTAAFIFEQYIKKIPPEQIATALICEYQVDPLDALDDVKSFIKQLQQIGLNPKKNRRSYFHKI